MIRVRGFPRVLVPIGRSRKAGPSAPLRNASLRMTNLGGVRAEKQKTTAGPLRLRSGQAFGFAQPPHGRRPVRGDPGATPRTKTCPRGPRRMTNHGGVRAEKQRTTAGPRRFAFPCLKIETWATRLEVRHAVRPAALHLKAAPKRDAGFLTFSAFSDAQHSFAEFNGSTRVLFCRARASFTAFPRGGPSCPRDLLTSFVGGFWKEHFVGIS